MDAENKHLNPISAVVLAAGILPAFVLLCIVSPTSVFAQEIPVSKLTNTKLSAGNGSGSSNLTRKTASKLAFELNEEGVKLVLQGQREEGSKKIKRALTLDPTNSTILYNAAGLFLTDGDAKKAVRMMERALKLEPKDLAFINRLAEAHFADSNIESAVQSYERLVKIDPTYEQALLRLGTLYAMLERWGQAEKTLRQALEHERKDVRVLTHLGTVLVVREKFAEAVDILRKAQGLSASAETETNLALAYEGLGQPRKALVHYRKAKVLGSDDPNLEDRIKTLAEANTK